MISRRRTHRSARRPPTPRAVPVPASEHASLPRREQAGRYLQPPAAAGTPSASSFRRGPRRTLTMTLTPPDPPDAPASAAEVAEGLRAVGYLPGESTALVAFLAMSSASRCSSRVPRASARRSSRRRSRATWARARAAAVLRGPRRGQGAVRVELPQAAAAIQAEGGGAGWEEVQEDIFGEEFLLARPLMSAIASAQPVVLLIDEIDKTDQEFEAMLLEVLSDFQISIPSSAAWSRARTPWCCSPPTTRGADRGAQAPLPVPVAGLPRARARARDRAAARARAARDGRAPARGGGGDGARARPQEAALDRRVDRLGAGAAAAGREDIDSETFRETMSVIVKHRTDMDIVAERVGLKLAACLSAARCPA